MKFIFLLLVAVAQGHVTLDLKTVAAGSSVLNLRVPHGCGHDGVSFATTRLVVSVIPEGSVLSLKPWFHAGWNPVVTTKPVTPFTDSGTTWSSLPDELVWEGGPLPNELNDQFMMTVRFAAGNANGTIVYFPVVQLCVNGTSTNWTSTTSSGEPAPKVTFLSAPSSLEGVSKDTWTTTDTVASVSLALVCIVLIERIGSHLVGYLAKKPKVTTTT